MSSQALATVDSPQATGVPAQADNDAHLIALWLGRHDSHNTRRNYQRAADRFLEFVDLPLRQVRLGDVQAFLASLEGKAPATRALYTASLKSLFSFGHQAGYLPFNVGAVVKAPPVKNTLAERILEEGDVLKLIALEPNQRNQALLRLAYAAGLRVSEVCALRWTDFKKRDDAGQVTVFGKAGKTRVVLLSSETWRVLMELKEEGDEDTPAFLSRMGNGAITPCQAHRIVKAAAKRAGLSEAVSAHWLRHAHASHSLDRGAPVHLVATTLGHSSVATTSRYLHAKTNDNSARYLGV